MHQILKLKDMDNKKTDYSEAGENLLHRIAREYSLERLAGSFDTLAADLASISQETETDVSEHIWMCMWMRDILNKAASETGQECFIPMIDLSE